MTINDLFSPLRKWWWLIVAATGLAALTGYLSSSQQPATYRASTIMMVGQGIDNPNPSGQEFWLSQQLALTYSSVAQWENHRVRTMEALGMTWLPAYDVSPRTNTQFIDISVIDTSPERAKVVSDELANQLILLSPTAPRSDEQARKDFINNQLDNLQIDITDTGEEISRKQEEIAELVSASQLSSAQNQLNALGAKSRALQANYASLLANTSQGAINAISIVNPATVPSAPIGPNIQLAAITAAAVGFALSAGAAFLLEYLDDTIKSPDDIKRAVDLPTLAGIARFQQEVEGKRELVTATQPRSPISEAYRVLRTGIRYSKVDRPIKSVLVTSSVPSEGKSVTSANLAVVMAQAGHRVLLIDADLRRPVQHTIFGLSKEPGLTRLLISLANSEDGGTGSDPSFSSQIQTTPEKGLFVLTSGPIPPNPSELLGSSRMRGAISMLSDRFDYVIIDSPPVLTVTDAVVLSAQTDCVLLVTDVGRTRTSHVKQAVHRLGEVDAYIVGFVLNRFARRTAGYYYPYYYQYRYEQDVEVPSGNKIRSMFGIGRKQKRHRSYSRSPERL